MLAGLIKLHIGQNLRPEEGLEAIRQRLAHSRSVEIQHIPLTLLRQLTPLLAHKRVSLHFPVDMDLGLPKSLGHKTVHIRYELQARYHGRMLNIGTIRFPAIMFDILWNEEQIFDISSISVSKCLSCTFRHRLRLDAEASTCLGSIWPVTQGIERLTRALEKAPQGMISNISGELLNPFIPLLKGKPFKLIMPAAAPPSPQLKELPGLRQFPPIVETSSSVYGQLVCCGGVCLPDIYFGIGWNDGRFISIRSLECPECVRCLTEVYRMSWLFGRRVH